MSIVTVMAPIRKSPGTIAFPASVLVILLFLLSSCEQAPEPLVVWSNVADTAFLVELYNHERDQPVHFRYVANLTEALTQQVVDADIVIGRWVDNPPARSMMSASGNESPWQPLAFNLGTIVFDAAHTRLTPDFAVTPDDLGSNLHPLGGDASEPMRFVPSRNGRFLYEWIRIGGMVPEPDRDGNPRWNPETFDAAFAAVREWQHNWNESPQAEQEYRERYLYEPWYRLLENRRVLAVYLPSNELLDWSFFAGTTLDFRWLQDENGTIHVLEDVVYGGVPAVSTRGTRALSFLTWARDPDTQMRLVEYKFEQRIDTFGVFGGFSTNSETNRRMVREFYTGLAGRIPDPESLSFPEYRPRYWDEALTAVVRPFILAAARSSDETVSERYRGNNLQAQLRRWYNQRGD